MKPLLTTTLSLAMLSQATAHQVCGARKDIIEGLGREYGETVRYEGINTEGNYLELLRSDKEGTFTLIATRPGGLTCIVDSGIGNARKNFDWGPQLHN